jgi:hypothetical protein
MLSIPERVLRWDGTGERDEPAPPPDASWVALARGLCERLGLHCSTRPLATVARALYTPESKQACHRGCGAVTVDMETAAIAAAAAGLGVPYLSVRYVLDTADETLPELGLRDGQGRLRLGGLLRAAARPRAVVGMAALMVRMRTHAGGVARLLGALLEEVG